MGIEYSPAARKRARQRNTTVPRTRGGYRGPAASPVTITRPDGTVEVKPAKRPPNPMSTNQRGRSTPPPHDG